MLTTKKIEYVIADQPFEAYCAVNPSITGKRPAVLVAHDWSGRNEFAEKKAEKLAQLGYVALALDMFGKGKLGKNNDEKSQLIQPLVTDRALLRKRMLAALDLLKNLENVDAARIAAIGFCFGGLCVLDLARSGVAIQGVVSFHGLLGAPNLAPERIKAKILTLHGHDDPMVPPEQVLAFEQEMTAAGADWQVHVYGNTMHGFTNPLANDPGFGTVYSTLAEKRSWLAMRNFFTEIFA